MTVDFEKPPLDDCEDTFFIVLTSENLYLTLNVIRSSKDFQLTFVPYNRKVQALTVPYLERRDQIAFTVEMLEDESIIFNFPSFGAFAIKLSQKVSLQAHSQSPRIFLQSIKVRRNSDVHDVQRNHLSTKLALDTRGEVLDERQGRRMFKENDVCFPCLNGSLALWDLKTTDSDSVNLTSHLHFEPHYLIAKAFGPRGSVSLVTSTSTFTLSVIQEKQYTVAQLKGQNYSVRFANVDLRRKDVFFGFAFVRSSAYFDRTEAYFVYNGTVFTLGTLPDGQKWLGIRLNDFDTNFSVIAEKMSSSRTSNVWYLLLSALVVFSLAIFFFGFGFCCQKKREKTYKEEEENVDKSGSNLMITSETEMKEFKVYNEFYGEANNSNPANGGDFAWPEVEKSSAKEKDVRTLSSDYLLEVRHANSFYNSSNLSDVEEEDDQEEEEEDVEVTRIDGDGESRELEAEREEV